jgi:hypothetical protein
VRAASIFQCAWAAGSSRAPAGTGIFGLDIDRLEAQCARWLGHPLGERLRFDLRPFSDAFEQIWQRTLAYGWSSEGLPIAGAAKVALDAYLLTLLLQGFSHMGRFSAQYRSAFGEDPSVTLRSGRAVAAAPISARSKP